MEKGSRIDEGGATISYDFKESTTFKKTHNT